MSEDSKKKIDLKARLGRRTVGASGPSIPPPMATGGSIPAPPFASKAPEPEAAPAPVVKPQAIKIEMGEEVIQAKKKAKAKWILIAVATAVVGGLLGSVIGGGMERQKRQQLALDGAEMLADEVDKANVEVEALAEILKKAKRRLSDGKYPEAELNELGGVSIPFNATQLVGKGTGLMSADVNRMLVTFAGQAQQANDQKDKLKRVMGGNKNAIEELLAQNEAATTKVQWSVVMVNGAYGPMAMMEPIPEPFLLTSKEKMDDPDPKKKGKKIPYAWPAELKVKDGGKEVKLERYTKGAVLQSTPQFFPVDPGSQGKVCAADTLVRIRREIVALENLLAGDKSDPTNEKAGLVDTGRALIDELKSIGH